MKKIVLILILCSTALISVNIPAEEEIENNSNIDIIENIPRWHLVDVWNGTLTGGNTGFDSPDIVDSEDKKQPLKPADELFVIIDVANFLTRYVSFFLLMIVIVFSIRYKNKAIERLI